MRIVVYYNPYVIQRNSLIQCYISYFNKIWIEVKLYSFYAHVGKHFLEIQFAQNITAVIENVYINIRLIFFCRGKL